MALQSDTIFLRRCLPPLEAWLPPAPDEAVVSGPAASVPAWVAGPVVPVLAEEELLGGVEEGAALSRVPARGGLCGC